MTCYLVPSSLAGARAGAIAKGPPAVRPAMSLLSAVVVFVVGLVSGIVVRAIAGLAAMVALLLVVFGVAAPEFGLVDYVIQQYYQGNELLFLAGLLFGIDAHRAGNAGADG